MLSSLWNHFFFARHPLPILGFMRIVYSFFLFLNIALLFPDRRLFFADSGLVSVSASQKVIDPDVWSLLYHLPATESWVTAFFLLFLIQILLFGLGIFARFQALCVFVYLVSIQHRNILIFDGEDVVFRLFAFFFIFSPSGSYFSVVPLIKRLFQVRKADDTSVSHEIWPLRLFQIQMTLIYFSTAIEKMRGKDWLDGTAVYYVLRLEEFERFPIPEWIHSNLSVIALLTWATVLFELFLPILLWVRETRIWAVGAAFLFHLSLDYHMNLNLFQWIMMTGLLSFLQGSSSPSVSTESMHGGASRFIRLFPLQRKLDS